MNIFKDTSELEQKVQKVEALMNELGISLFISNHSLVVTHNRQDYPFIDLDTQTNQVIEFPRRFEGIRIQAP